MEQVLADPTRHCPVIPGTTGYYMPGTTWYYWPGNLRAISGISSDFQYVQYTYIMHIYVHILLTERTFLKDGDTVTMTGYAQGEVKVKRLLTCYTWSLFEEHVCCTVFVLMWLSCCTLGISDWVWAMHGEYRACEQALDPAAWTTDSVMP
eukprot:146022-Amorphochlora_amoeboformis.AAC.1